MWEKYCSEHYDFYYKSGSTAEKDILMIANEQERCFLDITSRLNVHVTKKLLYHLLETPEEVGDIYGDFEPCNGFTRLPDKIYAVYNPLVKCIGYHEDAHIISYMALNKPNYNFMREGLAMYFDEMWQGVDNESWVQHYLKNDEIPSLSDLLDNCSFHKYGEWLTYPISGAFTKYLIICFGMERYKKFYKSIDRLIEYHFKVHFKKSIQQIEKDFIGYIDQLTVPQQHKKIINEKLFG